MSQRPIIRVQDVHKEFRYWSDRTTTLKSVLVNLSKGKFRSQGRTHFTALNGVSFDVQPGEFLGIMGKNGAGKSTLLKLICGIYSPTSGSVEVDGPISPLIELGAGFSPDLSGYENIFLNAAILGFGRKAAQEALPRILEFAEIGDLIHMPTKNYSSGMLVRLGFSVACHLTAPIILIDEVLAVGDAGFQDKCLRKINELHREGRTIILITHNPDAVARHCTRCIVIADHKKVYDGSPAEGVEVYKKAARGN